MHGNGAGSRSVSDCSSRSSGWSGSAERLFSRVSAKVWAVSAAIVAAGAWILFTYPPTTSRFYPQCTFHEMTGLLCPGCGTTRALHSLLHGRVAEAFAFNPMLFALAACALVALPSAVRGRTPPFLMKPWFGWTSFVVVMAWWVGRNLV